MKPELEKDTLEKTQKTRTGLRRQTVAAIVLAGVLTLLIVAQVVFSGVVKIYTLKDTYVDENGVRQIVKYTVKRDETGLYALYNKDGKKMETAPENGHNRYETGGQKVVVYDTEAGGNQYWINTATGEYSLYAAVDPEGDEVLGGTATNVRILMFPHLSEAEVTFLQVENASGKYRTQKDESGTTVLSVWNGEEWQASVIGTDRQAYVNLAVNCGYSLTMQKLDLSAADAPRTGEGKINYAVYGLDANDAENPPAVFTVGGSNGERYTVLVGDLTVTAEGYYVKRTDRDAVYIMDTGIAAVFSPVEALVAAKAFYPLSDTAYPMVENFFLWKVTSYNAEEETANSQLVTAFSYRDLSLREYTLYQPTPYVIPAEVDILKGYAINDWEIGELLSRFYRVQYLACKKLMPEPSDLAAYGLAENFHYLIFDYPVANDGNGTNVYVRNTVFISQKTYDEELGQEVCYLYSPPPGETDDPAVFTWGYDMIVAVDPFYFDFIGWEQSRWYNTYYLQTDLSFLRELHLTLGEKQYDFYLDNSKTGQANGLSVADLEVVCPQYDSPDHKLDYEIHTVAPSDTGGQTAVDYTGVKNFKRLISKLFMSTLEGDVDPAQFAAGTGMTVEEFIASDTADDRCVAKIRYHLEDYAAAYNPYWTENNRRDIVLRFYEYEPSGRKCLLTVEVLERDANGDLITDENGEVYTDATRANGLFFVNTSSLGFIAGYAEDLLNRVLIPQ